jgi:acyl dehydratase
MTALLAPVWQVGDRLGPLDGGVVTRTRIALFAGGSGDHNEIHLDPDVARAAGMDDVFAQGMLSMAYLGRLLTDTFGQAAVTSFTSRFTAITPVGATPQCTGQVVERDGEIAVLDLTVGLPDGTVTLRGRAHIDLSQVHLGRDTT